jgi:hypothetical protein
LVAVGVVVSVASAGPEWACTPDQIAVDLYDVGDGGGYRSKTETLEDTARVLAEDRVAAESALVLPTDPDDGHLYVQGDVVAEVTFAELPDGSWTVSTVRYCPPAPVTGASSPLPTSAEEDS